MQQGPDNTETILVVDDQASMRRFIANFLIDKGYQCLTAADGNIALQALRQRRFALVILNVQIPGKSGLEVLRDIAQRHADTAVIMITATDDAKTAMEMTKIGAYDYIIKPVNVLALLVRVRSALEKRRLLLENKEYQLYLEDKVSRQTDKIRRSFLNSITSLVFALEARDRYTSGHSQRVSKVAMSIAIGMNLPAVATEKIRLAGLLHDIGKIGIKESVLLKKGKLTDTEYAHISAHSVIGERILKPIVDDTEILKIVRHHHERYDGHGYPDGLADQNIPRGARILAVADTFDAMTSDRPYRRALSAELAISELKKQSGSQFDPACVEGFMNMYRNTELEQPAPLVSP